ncbi:MAG: Outer membrane receptor protein [Chlorobi bacterium OLB4]|nr:MAG: Outer membrane receptor protein [Chlorobi bacterium OLB4]MBW7854717.1 TonB-dependent receptor [Ignavibacteria bacterium]
MTNRFFLLIFTLVLIPLYTTHAQSASISGKVSDAITGEPLIGASIRLLDSNDGFINGTVSDISGNFEISSLDFGVYTIEIEYIGYNDFIKNGIKLDLENPNFNIGNIGMNTEGLSTEEIEVITEKPNVEISGEKFIYNIDKNVVAKGESVLDVLRRTPLISVDENDNVSIRGNSSVKILIDGRDTKSFNNLSQIPADLLKKVEVITNPSAKYESEGIAGILNLIMKKDENIGTNGNLNLSYGTRDIFNGGMDFNFNKNEFGASAMFYTGQWYNNLTGTNTRTNLFNDSLANIVGEVNAFNRSIWYFGGLNLDYNITENTYIEIFSEYTNSHWKYDSKTVTENFSPSNELLSYFDNNSKHSGTWKNISGGIFFYKKLNDNGHDLNVQVSVNIPQTDRSNHSFRYYFDGNGNSVTPQNPSDRIQVIDSWNVNFRDIISTIDYQLPINETDKFEAGYRGAIKRIEANYLSRYLEPQTGAFVTDANLSNDYDYDNNVQALYSVFTTELLHLGVKAGLRVEHTISDGNNRTSGETFKKNYTDFFPTLSISKKFNFAEEIRLSYSRRINRPQDWQLNPFTTQTSPQSYNRGNPELNPEYTNSIELSYLKFFGTFSVTPTIFYRQKTDNISNITTLTDSNVTYTTFENIGKSSDYGIDFIMGGRLFEIVSLNGTLSYYRREFNKETLPPGLDARGYQWSANISSSITLPEDFRVQVFYNYQGDNVTPMGKMTGFHNLGAGISKGFLGNKLNVSLSARDILNEGGFNWEMNGYGFTSNTDNKFSMQNLNLSVSYNFGEIKNKEKPRRKTEKTTAPPPQN